MTIAEQYQNAKTRVAGIKSDIQEVELALRNVEREVSASANAQAASLLARQARAADVALGRFHERSPDVAVVEPPSTVDPAAEVGLRARLNVLKTALADAELAVKGLRRRALEQLVHTAKQDYKARARDLFLTYEDVRQLEQDMAGSSHYAILAGSAGRFFIPGLSEEASYNGGLPGCDITDAKLWEAHARIQEKLKEVLGE